MLFYRTREVEAHVGKVWVEVISKFTQSNGNVRVEYDIVAKAKPGSALNLPTTITLFTSNHALTDTRDVVKKAEEIIQDIEKK